MSEKPGIMLYFDTWIPMLKLEDSQLAQLFRSTVMYAKSGKLPVFSGVDEIFWEMIRPSLDRDAERYDLAITQRRYAGYKSARVRKGEETVSYDEWKDQRAQRALTDEHGSEPTTDTTTTTSPSTTPTSESVSNTKKLKNSYGEYNNVLLTESERDNLFDQYGEGKALKAIRYLDEYIERKGYKVKSHYLTIKKWVIGAVEKEEGNDRLDWMDSALQ